MDPRPLRPRKRKIVVDIGLKRWYIIRVMKRNKETFKVGDLAIVKTSVHDHQMASNRLGLIVEIQEEDVYLLKFSNGAELRFHSCTLQHPIPSTTGDNDGRQ